MKKMCAWLITWSVLGGFAASAALAETRLTFRGDFETGQIQPKHETHDGFFIKTLPNPQGSVAEIAISSGGAGPNSGLDTRVVSSDVVGSEVVKPRNGKYFIRSAVYFDKDYTRFSGNGGKNKPRSNINMNSHAFDYDKEGYFGFSIYVPKNFENELGKKGPQGKSMLLTVGAPSAETFFNLNVWVPETKSEAHWFIRTNLNPKSVSEKHSGTIIQVLDMGRVAPDKGQWTDFVIRFRSNPFSTTLNPAKKGITNAKDQTFEGNRGILQVWKAEGKASAIGEREMVLKVNKVNTPVGLVPHKSWKLDSSFRIYKHGWHQQPTTVKGPVWFGFDEIRFGLSQLDGTEFADVLPSQFACSDNCVAGTPQPNEAPPNPPVELTISQ